MSDVEIRLLDSVSEFDAASRLTAQIWADTEPKAPSSFLRALAHAGNFVAGAFDGPELVGVSIAFYGRDGEGLHLHSHITGVDSRFQNRSLGFALKQFQRSWALEQGIERIEWTADPLVRRNLYFNLVKLGATVVAYFPDFYGALQDGVNGDGESDRVLMSWNLSAPRAPQRVDDAAVVLQPDGAGAPFLTHAEGHVVRVWVPEDVVQMRQEDADGARAWREALREAFGGCLDRGYRAESITRDGWCILTR